jgi:hypothetical protein
VRRRARLGAWPCAGSGGSGAPPAALGSTLDTARVRNDCQLLFRAVPAVAFGPAVFLKRLVSASFVHAVDSPLSSGRRGLLGDCPIWSG